MAKTGGLKGLVVPTMTMPIADRIVTVRGLSFSDLSVLVRNFGPTLKELFGELSGSGIENLSVDDSAKFAMILVERTPGLAASIIALGSGEPDAVDEAACLPFPVQLGLIEGIITLTFAVEGGAKKVLETVIRLAQGVNGLVSDLTR